MRKVVLSVASCLLVSACSPGGTNQVKTSRPSMTAPASAGTLASPVAASPLPESASSLNCRLPVNSPTTQSDPIPGGWITFPGGQFTRDPASLPIRLQEHVPSYDRAVRHWLPVEYQYVAPDGLSYILHGTQAVPDASAFYLVNVNTGIRKLAHIAGPPQAPGSWTIIDYSSAGVYLFSQGIGPVPGLWLLDPNGGTVRLIEGSQYWSMVSGDDAWAAAVDNPTASPASQSSVYHLDITTAHVTRWYQSDSSVRLLSPTPEGGVLILVGDGDSAQLAILTGSGRLESLSSPVGMPVVQEAYLRHPGVWLSLRGGGLALYTKEDGVRIMTRSPEIFDVAGGCW